MAASKLKELQTEFVAESKKSDVKIEIIKAQLDFWSKFASGVLSMIAVVIAIGAYFNLKSVQDSDRRVYFYLIVLAAGLFLIYVVYHTLFSNRIVGHVVKNYGNLNKIISIFIEIEETLNKKFDELDRQTSVARDAAENLANAPLSNLISWHHSAELEKEANRVFAITIDLSWASNNKQLDVIFNDLIANEGDKYFYLVTSSSDVVQKNLKRIKDRLLKEIANHPSKDLANRLQIQMLADIEYDGVKIYKNKNFLLPIPNDIVIYKGNNIKPTVVISTKVVQTERDDNDLVNNYDVKFNDVDQVENIELWFNQTWIQLTGKSIYD